jgi:DNA-binding MarR family transcriptional regulator
MWEQPASEPKPERVPKPIWPDADVVELQGLLRRILRALRHRRHELPPEIADAMRIRNLSPRHVGALAVIARTEPLTVSELAEHLGVSLTAASLLGSELHMASLVERIEDELDRRRTVLRITEPFRHSAQEWLDERARPLRNALDRLEPRQRAAFVAGLAALAEELEAAAPAEPHGPPRHRRRRRGG